MFSCTWMCLRFEARALTERYLKMTTHVTKVKALYKALLKLHRGLPLELSALGNEYVKEEFRKHKKANEAETHVFLGEWTKYYITLAKQITSKNTGQQLGLNLSSEMLDNFREEQLGQLMELLNETGNPAGREST